MATDVIYSTLDAPTLYVEANGIRYAYRDLGPREGVPLLCLQHFTGTLDNWDFSVIDELAANRRVLLFENAGVGNSTGETPNTIKGMSEHAIAFLKALNLSPVDVLGFSLGGFLAQYIALDQPSLLRRIILSGTGPEGGDGVGMDRPALLAIFTSDLPMAARLKKLFFPDNPEGQTAAQSFTDRLAERTVDADTPAVGAVAVAQLAAMAAWGSYEGERYAKLREIKHPVLVTNGNNDIMIPTSNSFALAAHLPNATLIIYPNSGHGALYQHGAAYVAHVLEFLDGPDA